MSKRLVHVSLSDYAHGWEEECGSRCSVQAARSVSDLFCFHDKQEVIKEEYANDEGFCRSYHPLADGERHDHYTLRDRYILMNGECVTRSQ